MTDTKVKVWIVSAITILAFLAPSLGQVGKVVAQEETNLPTVQTAVICERVENRTPMGIRESYPSSIGRLFCFTELAEIPSEGTIHHIWYYGNREMARVELPISLPRWRTWSSKTILPEWKGDWRVEIIHGDYVLTTITFAIQQ